MVSFLFSVAVTKTSPATIPLFKGMGATRGKTLCVESVGKNEVYSFYSPTGASDYTTTSDNGLYVYEACCYCGGGDRPESIIVSQFLSWNGNWKCTDITIKTTTTTKGKPLLEP